MKILTRFALALVALLICLHQAYSNPALISHSPQISGQANPVSENIVPEVTIPKSWVHILTKFLLGIHEIFVEQWGGPFFGAIESIFYSTGLKYKNHCQVIRNKLPDLTGLRVDFVRKMMLKLDQVQITQTVSQISGNIVSRTQHSRLGEILKNDPSLRKAIAETIHTDGVLECVLVAILDTARLVAYGLFFGIGYIGMMMLWAKVRLQLVFALKLGAGFFLPPIFFAVNLFIFYLFYQSEIGPIVEIFKKNLSG